MTPLLRITYSILHWHVPVKALFCLVLVCRYTIMKSCWEEDPIDRPSFSELVKKLTADLSSMADYLALVDSEK